MPNADKKKVEQVTTQPVQVKKKTRGRKFLEAFVDEDAGNIKDYLIFDLLIPALKDGFVKGITSTVEMIFYGKGGGKSRNSGNPTYVSYSSYSSKPSTSSGNTRRRVVDYDDIIFNSRVEAEHVLDTLCGIIEQYGQASIADYYDCVGVTGRGYTDNDFGWMDLRSAYVTRRAGGWTINLPRAIDLK